MKINGRITILIDREKTRIELLDADARVTFASITLTPEQLSSSLSRLANTECDIEVFGLEKLGKKMEHKSFNFQLPRQMDSNDSGELGKICQEILDKEGEKWVADSYFGSRDTFFTKDGKYYARCIVRRWV